MSTRAEALLVCAGGQAGGLHVPGGPVAVLPVVPGEKAALKPKGSTNMAPSIPWHVHIRVSLHSCGSCCSLCGHLGVCCGVHGTVRGCPGLGVVVKGKAECGERGDGYQQARSPVSAVPAHIGTHNLTALRLGVVVTHAGCLKG